MNQHMMHVLGRTTKAQLNWIKYVRKVAGYRQIVAQKVRALNAAAAAPTAPSLRMRRKTKSSFSPVRVTMMWKRIAFQSPESGEDSTEDQLYGAIRALVIRARWIEFRHSVTLVAIAEAVFHHLPIAPHSRHSGEHVDH